MAKIPVLTCRALCLLLVDPGLSYEYTTFVDPGRGEDVLIVGMTKFGHDPASPAEIAAHRAALASLRMLWRPISGERRDRAQAIPSA